MDVKKSKKRIAHNNSNFSNENETDFLQTDYVTDIMNAMNITRSLSDQNIISYKQLQEFRNQKRKEASAEGSSHNSNTQKELYPNNWSQYKGFNIKKKHPLMAKCQKNLKILKHNRSMPKPRAHVGQNITVKQKTIVKSDSKAPKRKVHTNNHFVQPSSSTLRRAGNRCRISESDSSEIENSTIDTLIESTVGKSIEESDLNINAISSESDSGYEKFIQSQISKVNKRKPEFSSEASSSSDESVVQKSECNLKKSSKKTKKRRWRLTKKRKPVVRESDIPIIDASLRPSYTVEEEELSENDGLVNDAVFSSCESSSEQTDQKNTGIQKVPQPLSVKSGNTSVLSSDLESECLSTRMRNSSDQVVEDESSVTFVQNQDSESESKLSVKRDVVNGCLGISECEYNFQENKDMQLEELDRKSDLGIQINSVFTMKGQTHIKSESSDSDIEIIMVKDDKKRKRLPTTCTVTDDNVPSTSGFHLIKDENTAGDREKKICDGDVFDEKKYSQKNITEKSDIINADVFNTLKKIDINVIKKYVEMSSVEKASNSTVSTHVQGSDLDVEIICLDSNDSAKTQKVQQSSLANIVAKPVNILGASSDSCNSGRCQNDPVSSLDIRNSHRKRSVTPESVGENVQAFDVSSLKCDSEESTLNCSKHLSSDIYNIDHPSEKQHNSINAIDDQDLASYIERISRMKKDNPLSLLELYTKEYKKYLEVRSTEKNVSAGLKLLEEEQLKKCKYIYATITKLTKVDSAFQKIVEKAKRIHSLRDKHPEKTSSEVNIAKRRGLSEHQQERSSYGEAKSCIPKVEQDEPGHLRVNCVECGKPACAACLGCAKVYYCSKECGESYWMKGHSLICGR